ncbi:hypothetical protein [Pedobacter sp. B4-66]|uniref:hypothetical protein n=1 Tax=Pedobacter sp. B4-66 TaxID=2817280 RepID=UPI001BD9C070|nr:hypothetical protein [Pedobacter sp. B4-66]
MENELGRIEQDLLRWKNREQRFEKLFDGDVIKSSPFLKEKLEYLEGLALKYKETSNTDERIALKVLQKNRRDLERNLFPGFFKRMFYRISKSISVNQRLQHIRNSTAANIDQLKSEVSLMGFAQSNHLVEIKIQQGNREFSIPVTYYVNKDDRMDFNLNFKADQTGQYQFDGYEASLKRANGEMPDRSVSIGKNGMNEYITGQQAYNLLCGRSVYLQKEWVQLDFNDKFPDGNFRTKVFPSGYGYDIERELEKLKTKDLQSPEQKEKIIEALKNGDQVMIEVNGKKVQVEANPQTQSLNIYGSSKNVIQFRHTARVIKEETTPEQKREVRNRMKIH